ncbi:hypothetical protein R3P38DRAFT_2829837 [Favolaschia claudopus]|uniref:Uncharacterized protein n=1 Tax=Favolaschia claudopus TaxID=2862362 RepID=A0AAW0E7K6_9AGAR
MDVQSTSPDPAPVPAASQETSAAERISAYYSLVFPTVTFYVRTLSVSIGRRCSPNPNLATSSVPDNFQVDVDLGALKSVSRLHAKIEYDQDEDRFMLLVLGRNGAWVDGVWAASGTRASLGERSQIQIASRTFHFVLPPPPPPEDTPSPSSQSSNNRARSPSVDITSISPPSTPPSHSPPPVDTKPPPPLPEPQIPTSKPTAAKTNPKKRKKPDAPSPPKPIPKPLPTEIPEKPSLTLRQLILSAIKDLGGKATLQEVCTWIMNSYEYYQHVDDKWMGSVRHTLSSDKQFKKLEKSTGARGKGYFWAIDDDVEGNPATPALVGSPPRAVKSSKASKGTKKKDKSGGKIDFSKGQSTSIPLDVSPPAPAPVSAPTPATSTTTTAPKPDPSLVSTANPPPAPTLTTATVPPPSQVATGVFAYSSLSSSSPYPSHNPYACLTQGKWSMSSAAPSSATPSTTPTPAPPPPTSSTQPPTQSSDVSIPIILAPIPPTHPDHAPSHPNNSAKEGYMILHERTLILDPDVFSGLSKEKLKELEDMGARKALGVLAEHMLRVLKERRAAARARIRGRGRGRGLPKGRAGPPSSHEDPRSLPPDDGSGVRGEKVPLTVVSPPPPVPIVSGNAAATHTGNGRADSPVIVVDDSDGEDMPAAKRRKIDEGAPTVVDATMSIIG